MEMFTRDITDSPVTYRTYILKSLAILRTNFELTNKVRTHIWERGAALFD